MPLNKLLFSELRHEAGNTRKTLQRIPDDQFNWKPHEKSMTLKRLSSHLADIYQWPLLILNESEFDVLKGGYQQSNPESTAALLADFERNLNNSLQLLDNTSDERLEPSWTLRRGEQILFTLPRRQVIRSLLMNHAIHHRGQLTVYLRMLNVPVPAIYGPSADEAF